MSDLIIILQRGTPWYDGTGGVSQCAINPGETFIYRFVVDKVINYKTMSVFYLIFIVVVVVVVTICNKG